MLALDYTVYFYISLIPRLSLRAMERLVGPGNEATSI